MSKSKKEEVSLWGDPPQEDPEIIKALIGRPPHPWGIEDRPNLFNIHPKDEVKKCKHCGKYKTECECYCEDCGNLKDDCTCNDNDHDDHSICERCNSCIDCGGCDCERDEDGELIPTEDELAIARARQTMFAYRETRRQETIATLEEIEAVVREDL